MTANLEPDIYPSRKYDFDTLMFCFGAEPVPAQGGHSRRQSTRIWGGAGFGCALAVAYGHSRARQTPGLEQSRGVDSARVGMAGGRRATDEVRRAAQVARHRFGSDDRGWPCGGGRQRKVLLRTWRPLDRSRKRLMPTLLSCDIIRGTKIDSPAGRFSSCPSPTSTKEQ